MKVRWQNACHALQNLAEVTTENFTCKIKLTRRSNEDNFSHNKLVSKNSVVITSILFFINPLLKEKFAKAETNVKFGDNVHKLVELIPNIGQQQHEDLVYSRFVTFTKNLSDTIKKDSFVTSTTKQKGHITDLKIVKERPRFQ